MTKREIELASAGWERRFIASEPRLSEMAEMYREIGFEVILEPLSPKEEMNGQDCGESGCTVCLDAERDKYRVIFTRPEGQR